MTIIAVTNNGAEAFSCKYDGILFSFPAGESTPVPIEAAQHIFGLGKSDKQEVMSRHGWLTHSSGLAAGHAKLNSFAFGIHKDHEPEIPALILSELEQARQTPTDEEEIQGLLADDKEHRSAPMLTGTGAKASSDGLADAPVTATEKEVEKAADEPVFLGTLSLKKKSGA